MRQGVPRIDEGGRFRLRAANGMEHQPLDRDLPSRCVAGVPYIYKLIPDFHFCRSPFGARQAATPAAAKQKEPDKQHKSAACQAWCHIHFSIMKVAYWRADPCLRNETVPPCIMLKQTSDPCPGLASRFPGPHTFPAGRAVLPWRYLRSAPGLLARSGSKFSIQFSLPRPRSRSARTL